MVVQVTSGVVATMLAEAARAAPAECCGILLGREVLGREQIEEARPAANVAADPLRRFEIDPAALIAAHRAARAGGPCVLGYYHSHPTGAPDPSATDRELAGGDGRVWAIVGAGQAAFWRDRAEGFEAIEAQVVEA